MNNESDSGIGSRPVNRPKPAAPTSPKDENSFVWKPYKPGIEINQHGHLRTTSLPPAIVQNYVPDEIDYLNDQIW
jgi:hypothetical protein